MSFLNKTALLTLLALQGCSSAPPVQKASDVKSYFDGAVYPGEIYKLAEDNSGAEQYRVFSHGSTGFVSLASVQSNAEGRAKDFCEKEQKTIKILQQQTSTPPHVLGNFPRVELIFICMDKKAPIAQDNPNPYQKLAQLKALLDSGAITKSEYAVQKDKILNSK